jgi:hypothetical protein
MNKTRGFSIISCRYLLFIFSLSFILLTCKKDDPIKPVIDQNDDKYLFIEMAVYTTGKPIPVNGSCRFIYISYPQYKYYSDSGKMIVAPQIQNKIQEKDNCILGLYAAIGPDVGSGDVGVVKTLSDTPHLDTILNTYDRKKMIIISKILSDGNIEIIFRNQVITIPIDGFYQEKVRTENIKMRFPDGYFQPYEYIDDLYSVKNWGYINKKDIIKS